MPEPKGPPEQARIDAVDGGASAPQDRSLHLRRLPWCCAAGLTACSIANLPYHDVMEQVDSVASVQGTGAEQRLTYEQKVTTAPWYLRFAPFVPLRPLLGTVFGYSTASELENPSGHMRELLACLPAKAGADLVRAAEVSGWLVRVAELDPSPLNRIIALDGIEVLAALQDIPIIGGPLIDPRKATSAADLEAASETLRALHPIARARAGRRQLDAAEHRKYGSALQELAAAPWPQWYQRLALVEQLGKALPAEADAELQTATASALRLALGHSLRWTVVRSLQGQEREFALVRLRAMDLVRRAGGPDSVPLLLALMANRPEAVADGKPRFDPDPFVRRRLAHFCGQLDRARATVAADLPGREAWDRTTAIDFLAQTLLDLDDRFEQTHDAGAGALASPLQPVLVDALARVLQRPRVEQDLAWVRAFYADYRRPTGAASRP
jgi:hypothetical protein